MMRWAKRRKAMERRDACGRDRLGDLPDALLIHIFSFVDTKQAVQSCVLSKQWVQFWTLLPDLDFDSDQFRRLSFFNKFVNKVLTHRDSSVKIRRIKFMHPGSCTKLTERMLKYAVSHSVQHMDVSSLCYIELPSSCDSLKTMKLDRVQLKNSLCFKQLVSLYLSLADFRSFEIFSGCPNLEQLTLSDCCFGKEFVIIAPQLSRVCIEMLTLHPRLAFFKIVLSTPRLTYLRFLGLIPCVSQTNGLPLLEAIVVELHDSYEEEERLDLVSVLKCFFNVKRMRLSYGLIEILSKLLNMSAQEPSPFCNMEVLNIIPSPSCKLFTIPVHVMMYLLGNSPHAKIVVEEKR